MRSLYLRILLVSILTAIVSLLAFMSITRTFIERTSAKLWPAAYGLQLEEAVDAYRNGGAPQLSSFITKLNAAFGFTHFVTDAAGRDLVSGDDRAWMIAVDPAAPDRPRSVDGRLIIVRTSPDKQYRLIAVVTPPFTIWTFAPYYLLVIASVLCISWVVAVGIASPLRTLAATVDRFGRGDLAARVTYAGKNEIGRLARSFNEMAARLQTLVTAERRLLQDVSHELRSPLARLNVGIELARTAADRDAALDRLKRESDRLSALVGELLDMTRAEGDPDARTLEPVRVESVVAEVVQACALDAAARSCHVVVSGMSSRQLHGDRELLRRAVENVLRNAIRYAPAGTNVDVVLQDEPSRTLLVVRDRGRGVPDELLSKIFQSFYRVDESRDSATGGIGLGLAITMRAIRLHHGNVTAENAAPGLRVTVALPTVSA